MRILVPVAASLDGVVLGGDRRSVEAVLADRRLAGLLPLVSGRCLDLPDPRLTVLKATPAKFRAVAIDVTDLCKEPGGDDTNS